MKHLKRTWFGFIFACGLFFMVNGCLFFYHNFTIAFTAGGLVILFWIMGYVVEMIEEKGTLPWEETLT
jgi:hypothetical protein